MPINRDCLDGRGITTSAGNWFQIYNCREETVVEGIDTPSWNTELATVSSRILNVWSQIQWCQYCDQSVDYSVHHHSSCLISKYFQCIPTQLLHHKNRASFAARRMYRLTVWPAQVIRRTEAPRGNFVLLSIRRNKKTIQGLVGQKFATNFGLFGNLFVLVESSATRWLQEAKLSLR